MTDFYAQLERQLLEAGRRRTGRGRWRLAPAGRGRAVLAMATASIAVVVGVAFAPALRSGDSSDAGGGGTAPPAPPAVTSPPAPPGGVSLRGIQVAVLNATTITGLGREAGAVLEANGATLRSINSAPQQDLTRSVIEFRAGAEEQAKLVGLVLGVHRTRALRAAGFAAAPTAAVIVWVGSDRRRR